MHSLLFYFLRINIKKTICLFFNPKRKRKKKGHVLFLVNPFLYSLNLTIYFSAITRTEKFKLDHTCHRSLGNFTLPSYGPSNNRTSFHVLYFCEIFCTH